MPLLHLCCSQFCIHTKNQSYRQKTLSFLLSLRLSSWLQGWEGLRCNSHCCFDSGWRPCLDKHRFVTKDGDANGSPLVSPGWHHDPWWARVKMAYSGNNLKLPPAAAQIITSHQWQWNWLNHDKRFNCSRPPFILTCLTNPLLCHMNTCKRTVEHLWVKMISQGAWGTI